MKYQAMILPLFVLLPVCPWLQAAAPQEFDPSAGLRSQALNVYIDCQRCDQDHIHREITFVNYMIDPKDAQVHILITTQRTASGGLEYTLTFLGQHDFAGKNDTLQVVTIQDDTEEMVRDKLVSGLKMGLMSYVAKTPLASQVRISFAREMEAMAVEDNWNSWVFRLRSSGRFDAEESENEINLSGSVSANRITEAWKIRSSYDQHYDEENFYFEDDTSSSIRRTQRANGLVVKSFGEHLSAGISANFNSSTYRNIKRSVMIAPAIEYNLFPYSESTRRELRINWGVGMENVQYIDTTIYDKTAEILMGSAIDITFEIKEKWGSIRTSLDVRVYLHDLEKNSQALFCDLELRLWKGLSLNLFGRVEAIHNQLYLTKGEASYEDILLERQQQATDFRYWGSVGLSYTFGSIYNNIVNPRFGNGGGGGRR